MKYALLIYDKPGSHEALPDQEREAVYGEYFALSRDPRCVGGAQLQPVATATTESAPITVWLNRGARESITAVSRYGSTVCATTTPRAPSRPRRCRSSPRRRG